MTPEGHPILATWPPAVTRGALAERVVELGRALRLHGGRAGTSEISDAAAVAAALGLEDRERLRAGLAAALMRRAGDRAIFDQLFDLHFPAAVGVRGQDLEAASAPVEASEVRAHASALRDELEQALAVSDHEALERLAARVVAELGKVANDSSMGGWSANQALDRLSPQTAIAGALQRARDAGAVPGGSGAGQAGSGGGGGGQSGSGGGGGGGGAADTTGETPGGLRRRLEREEIREQVAAFRRRVRSETARRNAEVRGRERIARYGVREPLERREFLLTSTAEASDLQAAIAPLSRKLAARLAARTRRRSRGSIDVRRTLRAAMSTGGVPVRPAYRRRTRSRADIVLLCDMSGSVSGFSRFTMLLLQAMAGHFRRVRFFAFVNITDEITELVRDALPGEDLSAMVTRSATITRWHGSSDYGSALTDFAEHHLDAVGPRSTVLILGDARTNGSHPRVDALAMIAERAHHVAWLNPEPVGQWRSGDSVAHLYAEVVDMHECRTIDQLRHFVTRVLPD